MWPPKSDTDLATIGSSAYRVYRYEVYYQAQVGDTLAQIKTQLNAA
ncbi:hypothetical protein [Paenibacillus dendritiformis]|nr:hypothetical protein [Paenibacillus dendritiformis]GIO75147.1 hypothetical protein J27TS7_46610 [Paenibacillus dendritiformis]CAH8773149.1 hypothetical protein H7S4_005897 [Paenibacillus dendritiformis]